MNMLTYGIVSSDNGEIIFWGRDKTSLELSGLLDGNIPFNINDTFSMNYLKDKLTKNNLADSYSNVLLHKYNYDLYTTKNNIKELSLYIVKQNHAFNACLSMFPKHSDEYTILAKSFSKSSDEKQTEMKNLRSYMDFLMKKIDKLKK